MQEHVLEYSGYVQQGIQQARDDIAKVLSGDYRQVADDEDGQGSADEKESAGGAKKANKKKNKKKKKKKKKNK